jgi:ceramide glucosyltransferase
MNLVLAALYVAAGCGLALLVAELAILRRHLTRQQPRATRERPPISILKPLCGLDDGLARNLSSFAALPYPAYEVLLGVRDMADPAYPVASAAVRRWPSRFRVVVQEGAPGLNPKVNQLMTLARAARHDILLVSDSNTRVPPGYLDEIAALLEDGGVGLVTHPLAGASEGGADGRTRIGSLLDNLHLTGSITPGLAAAKHLCGKDYVVGKSMAMRRADLDELGGFGAAKDVLAEDFVLGRLVPEKLGKRVALAQSVVTCVSARRSVAGFVRRYARWSVMQRQCAGHCAYLGLLLLNPLLPVTAALLVRPSLITLVAWGACAAARMAQDAAAGRLLRADGFSVAALMLTPLRDLLAAAAWARGLTTRSIEWRSNRLLVLRGSALRRRPQPKRRRLAGSGRDRVSAAA